ncbi:hypothetical protein [Intestinimonas butyriciproducens]|uniref:hypothetical protein n=1 Tax=Intestinimonas butyriciproducens TaxID=1297617 RepID=UPI0009511BFE|nr:hypothetical protein [Intestinimonas butyriciproducens]OLR66883.1 hypothetical protein BIV19_04355 [Intestinimonas butyriciproducens]
MDIDKLIEAVRLCGSSPTIYQCEACAYYTGGDMGACIPEMTAQAAAALSALRAELEQAKRERDAAVECIQFIVTYLELNSTKDIRKTIEAWKSGLKEG